ncbi:MAG: hypothetical protein AB4426_20735 [Xenococcaceae cyanobacterium]
MTTANNIKQQQGRRMKELFDISRQRYLDAGGDPRKAVNCNDWLTTEELQEFSELSRNVVRDEDIANYLKKNGTWQERYAAMKETMKSEK